MKALWDLNTIATMFLLPSTAHFPNRDTLQHDSKCLQNPSCHGAHGSLCIITACKSSLLSFHPLPKIFPQQFYSKPLENKKRQESCHMRLTAFRCNTTERCDVARSEGLRSSKMDAARFLKPYFSTDMKCRDV